MYMIIYSLHAAMGFSWSQRDKDTIANVSVILACDGMGFSAVCISTYVSIQYVFSLHIQLFMMTS